jgi:hypothetical protein
VQFKTADFLYRRTEMSAGNIDDLLDIWAESNENGDPPFKSHEHLYETIDSTKHGDAPWKCLAVSYNGEVSDPCPSWQNGEWEVFYRDTDVVLTQMLENPDFDGQFDYAAYIGLDKAGKRYWSDFMSGNFAYRRSVCPFLFGELQNKANHIFFYLDRNIQQRSKHKRGIVLPYNPWK